MTLYTASEIADKLKIKPITVMRLFDDGALSGIIIRQGIRKRVIRFREEDIAKFLTTRAKRVSK